MRLLLLILCLHAANLAAAPRVVTSIQPVQEVTAAIMAGVGVPDLIIDGHASPHHFTLKPSQMRRLQQADLVIWISRSFEGGFLRLAEVLPATTDRLELLPALGVDTQDGHFWFAPDLLLGAIDAIVAALERSDPTHRAIYRANAATLAKAIAKWRDEIQARWAGRSPRLLTDHDFLHHFSRAFGFTPVESIHDHHDDHAGLKKLNHLEDLLREGTTGCLLFQSGELSPLAAELAQKFQLQVVELAPNADEARPGAGILGRLDRLGRALDSCA